MPCRRPGCRRPPSSRARSTAVLAGAALAACLALRPPAQAGGLTLMETGSTLMLPLLRSWVQGCGKVAPDLRITTAGTGSGAGIAAAIAKIGAGIAAFLFPILLVAIGTRFLLYILIVTSVLGAAVTWLTRIETTGVNLDRMGE